MAWWFVYLNVGTDADGHSRFREVGEQAGLEPTGADDDLDGRLDLYVANDADPNRLYLNVAWPGGAEADPARIGFRLEDVARREAVADPNAGMGIAAADANLDGRPDLF